MYRVSKKYLYILSYNIIHMIYNEKCIMKNLKDILTNDYVFKSQTIEF